MIAGIFHEGSGLGNQLHRYVFTRIKALELGVSFGMIGIFKGKSFMNIDLGETVHDITENFLEERINHYNGDDIRPYDEKTKLIKDNTLVDGEFQDERYWEKHERKVRDWLKVEPLKIPEDVCVIGFRGGEYVGVASLFLTKDYWEQAIKLMKEINPNMKFEVHTDDPATAREYFPDYPVIHNMEVNWRSVRYARYLIVANSSFYIFPAWLNEQAYVIAPKYWARRNLGFWALPQNEYKRFTYI